MEKIDQKGICIKNVEYIAIDGNAEGNTLNNIPNTKHMLYGIAISKHFENILNLYNTRQGN